MSKRIQYRYHIITVIDTGHGANASISGVTVGSISESVFAKTAEEAIAKAKQKIDKKLEEAYPSAELKREMQRDLVIQDYQYFVEFLKLQGVPDEQIPAIAANLTLSTSTRMAVEIADTVGIWGNVSVDGTVNTQS